MAVAGLMLTSCAKDYDDDLATINKRVDNLEGRVSALEQWHNDNIDALQQIINIQQSGSYISAITPLASGDGYVMTFGNGQTFTVHDGKDGQDGHSPIIGVRQDTDGIYYWTLDGEWLLDADGQKVRTTGKDGQDAIAPQVRINPTTLEWEISLDNGATWTSTGVVAKEQDGTDGDAFFKSVTTDEVSGKVTFTLADGTTFELPYFSSLQAVKNRLQSMVYVPDYVDGKMTITAGEATTAVVTYAVKPAAVATFMAENKDKLAFVVEDGLQTTRAASTSATLTISSVTANGERLTITATANGFVGGQGYAVALDFGDGTSDYRSAYTPVWVKMTDATVSITAEGGVTSGVTLIPGDLLQLTADIQTGDAVSTWSSSNTSVAVVSADGLVTARSEGVATIIVTTVQGATATFIVNVSAGAIEVHDGDGIDQGEAEARRH